MVVVMPSKLYVEFNCAAKIGAVYAFILLPNATSNGTANLTELS